MQEYINPYNPPHPYRLTRDQRIFLTQWGIRRKQSKWVFFFLNGFFKYCLWVFLFIKAIQIIFYSTATIQFYYSFSGCMFLIVEILFFLFSSLVIGWLNYTRKEAEYEYLFSLRHF
jgi:hypothetical protein